MLFLICVLCLALHPETSDVYDLRALIRPPVELVGQSWRIEEQRSHTKEIPSGGKVSKSVTSSKATFRQEALQVKESNELLSVLRTYEGASITQEGKTVDAPFAKKLVMFQKDFSHKWSGSCFVLEKDARKDVMIEPRFILAEARSIDTTRHNYQSFQAGLPKGPVKLQDSWQIGPNLIAEDLQKMEGLDEKQSSLSMTLESVSETQLTFSIKGHVLLSSKPNPKGSMSWRGEVQATLVIDRGSYRELSREITIKEQVTMTMGEQKINASGSQSLHRTVKRVPMPKSKDKP